MEKEQLKFLFHYYAGKKIFITTKKYPCVRLWPRENLPFPLSFFTHCSGALLPLKRTSHRKYVASVSSWLPCLPHNRSLLSPRINLPNGLAMLGFRRWFFLFALLWLFSITKPASTLDEMVYLYLLYFLGMLHSLWHSFLEYKY